MEDLIGQGQTDAIIEAAKALGNAGVMGYDNPATLQFYALAMRLDSAKEKLQAQAAEAYAQYLLRSLTSRAKRHATMGNGKLLTEVFCWVILSVRSAPLGDAPTWATRVTTAMECVDARVAADLTSVETATFTRVVLYTMSAVPDMNTSASLASIYSASCATTIGLACFFVLLVDLNNLDTLFSIYKLDYS